MTPFPVRDAFALALLQPSAQSQFTSHGHLSDDLDVTLGRKRGRRISTSSVNTMRSKASEDGVKPEELRGGSIGSPDMRIRTGARVNFASKSQVGSSPSIPSGGGPSIRPSNRPRTSSVTSSISLLQMHASSSTMVTSTSASFPTILPDNSQRALERVISSRLVETFVSITVDPSSPEGMPGELPPDSSIATTSTTSQLNFPSIVASPERGKLPKEHRKSSSSSSLVRKVAQAPAQQVTMGKNLRRDSARATQLAASVVTDSTPKTNSAFHASSWSRSSLSKSRNAASTLQPLTHSPTVPDYISPIHRPSTNPFFAIDAKPGSELAGWANLSGQRVRVECWGKVGSDWSSAEESQRGKGKSKIASEDLEGKENWKVLEEWNVNLADLTPLPDHVSSECLFPSNFPDYPQNQLSSDPSQLPSNTLLITLSPQGQTYYLPSKIGRTRSPSPSAAYNSDPESLSRKGRITSSALEVTERQVSGQFARGVRRNGTAARESQFVTKTAGWQDLLK